MIVVGDIVEIVGGYEGQFNGRTTDVLEVTTYSNGKTVYRLNMAPLFSMGVLFHAHDIRLVKEHKVLQILRTWRDSRLETE